MEEKDILVNPRAKEIGSDSIANQSEKKLVNQIPKQQTKMQLNSNSEALQQTFSGYKAKLNRRLDLIEIMPLWKSMSVPAMFVILFSNISFLLFILVFRSKDLPQNIRFFYNSSESTWIQISSEELWIVLIFKLIVFLILIRLVLFIFKQDKRLAQVLAWLFAFLGLMFFVSILSLYRTYI